MSAFTHWIWKMFLVVGVIFMALAALLPFGGLRELCQYAFIISFVLMFVVDYTHPVKKNHRK